MGFFSNVLGNSSELTIDELGGEFIEILIEGEEMVKAYKVFRDKWIFTNKRLVIQDIQGISGKKVEYKSIPYKNIVMFSVETAGNFDADGELKLWISSQALPKKYKFSRDVDVLELQKILYRFISN